jgi:hypothetical protein
MSQQPGKIPPALIHLSVRRKTDLDAGDSFETTLDTVRAKCETFGEEFRQAQEESDREAQTEK